MAPQLQNLDTPLTFNTFDPRKATRFREVADKMQSAIDVKKNSSVGQQRPTARRTRIAEAMYEEGLRLEQIQSWLRVMANAAEAGNLPQCLSGISAKNQLEVLAAIGKSNWKDKDLKQVFVKDSYADWRSRLAKAGICSAGQLKSATDALIHLHSVPTPDPIELQIRRLERDLIGRDIPGYFPTPKAIVKRIIEAAELHPALKILEPSAGRGDIAQGIRAIGVEPDCIEFENSLRQILELKKFNIIGSDFLSLEPRPVYNRVLMNPPFEQGQDIQHVRRAYDWLAPGGRLVAIVSNSFTFRNDKKYQQFRDWLIKIEATEHELPNGAFLESDCPTGVKVRMLVIGRS